MKTLLIGMLLIPALSFSQIMLPTQLLVKPEVLMLNKYRKANGDLELRHIVGRQNIRISSPSPEVAQVTKALMESDMNKLYCDGDVELSFDPLGIQYLNIKSLNVCIDEEGSIIASSVGIKKLADKVIQEKKKVITDKVNALAINDSKIGKVIDKEKEGFISDKLKSTKQK